jgi:hypothetical protein
LQRCAESSDDVAAEQVPFDAVMASAKPALAIELGYTMVFLASAACYAVAALLLPRWAPVP